MYPFTKDFVYQYFTAAVIYKRVNFSMPNNEYIPALASANNALVQYVVLQCFGRGNDFVFVEKYWLFYM